jgi:hypothetical protein
VDGLRFGKFQMEVGKEGSQTGGFFSEAFRGDTMEHSPAVVFHEFKDFVGGLLGVLSAGLVFEEKFGHGRMEVFDGLVDALHFGYGGEPGVISVQWIYELVVSVKASGMGGHLLGAVID